MDSEKATKFEVGDDSKQVKESCGDNISDHEESRSIESSIHNSSVNSTISSSSSDLTEDASSFTLSSSSSSSSSDDVQNGPLFELSDLMIHLPLRRSGLSKYYEGKSQSFTSLASVESVDDLAKKMSPYVMKKKMKTCKSYLNVQKSDITKKSQRGSTFLSNSFRISSRPKYSIPLHKINF